MAPAPAPARVATSAPGKVILCGEHAVVHGKTAIALSLGLRTYVLVEETGPAVPEATVHLDLPDIGINETWAVATLDSLCRELFNASMDTPVSATMREKLETFAGYDGTSKSLAKVSFLYLYLALAVQSGYRASCRVSVESTLPIGAGLGSSASFGTSLAAALLLLRERNSTGRSDATVSAADINTWAFRSEQLVHGNPSGLDNSTSTFGGAVSFRNGQANHLNKAPSLRFLLTNTNVERSTRTLVAQVHQKLADYPGVIMPVFDSIQGISTRVLELFNQHQNDPDSNALLESLGTLMTINHHLLNALGVGHPALDTICTTTSAYGLKSKLTGAGGGGCAITLISPDTGSDVVAGVKAALEQLGYTCVETEVAGPGVQEHEATGATRTAWPVVRRL